MVDWGSDVHDVRAAEKLLIARGDCPYREGDPEFGLFSFGFRRGYRHEQAESDRLERD